MKKEQRQYLKSIEKQVQNVMAIAVKNTSCKKYSYSIYETISEFFVFFIWDVFFDESQSQVQLRITFNFKPLAYDPLFWEIFDANECMNKAEGFRAIGAFTAPFVTWGGKKYVIDNVEAVDDLCARAIREFSEEGRDFVERLKVEYGSFESYLFKQTDDFVYREKLLKKLAYIHIGDYETAKNMAFSEWETGESGGFENRGKSINEYIIDHCRAKMSLLGLSDTCN